MLRKNTPGKYARSKTHSPHVKPILLGIVALTALAVIAWLAYVPLAPAPKGILSSDMAEFMRVSAPLSAPAAYVPETAAPEMAAAPGFVPRKEYSSPASVSSPSPVSFKFPQAGRDLLVPRRRVVGRGVERIVERATPRPPQIALAIAKAAIERPSVSEVAGDSARREVLPLRPKAGGLASTSALASASGAPEPALDDLFTLKLRAEYGTSGADPAGIDFRDRFLVLGGKKRFDFAGMDQVDLKMDGVLTTGGRWNTADMDQDLSGIALNIGPELKFPELPVKLDLNLGVGWLERDATLLGANDPRGARGAQAQIDSMVYGGGAALKSDWQWRMFTVTGLAGVQYAAANDRAHSYKWTDAAGAEYTGREIASRTSSAWELPLQVRIGGEYRLLNALSVLPSLWGGYTYNITGENGPFHSGHIAGADTAWRRNGMTWNKNSHHFGGELRIRAVDRFELWLAHQKEWAGDDSGSYTGGGMQIAF